MTDQKVKNLLQSRTTKIDFNELLELRKEYNMHLHENRFPAPPPNGSTIDMLIYLKRKNAGRRTRIGPYENITVFEAANRIASDLVLINGVIEMVEEGIEHPEQAITLHLGTKHVKGQGDFVIGEKHGEAFNVAESFYQAKLRSTLTKWKNSYLSYILVNADVVNQHQADNLQRMYGTKIVGVKYWQPVAV